MKITRSEEKWGTTKSRTPHEVKGKGFNDSDSDNECSVDIQYDDWPFCERAEDELWYCWCRSKEWPHAEWTSITIENEAMDLWLVFMRN